MQETSPPEASFVFIGEVVAGGDGNSIWGRQISTGYTSQKDWGLGFGADHGERINFNAQRNANLNGVKIPDC